MKSSTDGPARSRLGLISILSVLSVLSPCGAGAKSPTNELWTEVTEFDRRMLTDQAKKVLEMDLKWRHAETPHFVIHFEREIFAAKVARMAEFFYDYIAADLQGAKDRMPGKSHIFILRNEKRWEELRRSVGGIEEWVFSMVSGPTMYLQQAGDTTTSGDILAHEMTHLVFNRFFEGRPPIWLNEGVAEFYEEFAYSAMKGLKKSRKAQFQRLDRLYPVEKMLTATGYPSDAKDVQAFYETAKFMVGFLLLDRPADRFVPFVNTVVSGTESVEALGRHYGLGSVEAFTKEFVKFAR